MLTMRTIGKEADGEFSSVRAGGDYVAIVGIHSELPEHFSIRVRQADGQVSTHSVVAIADGFVAPDGVPDEDRVPPIAFDRFGLCEYCGQFLRDQYPGKSFAISTVIHDVSVPDVKMPPRMEDQILAQPKLPEPDTTVFDKTAEDYAAAVGKPSGHRWASASRVVCLELRASDFSDLIPVKTTAHFTLDMLPWLTSVTSESVLEDTRGVVDAVLSSLANMAQLLRFTAAVRQAVLETGNVTVKVLSSVHGDRSGMVGIDRPSGRACLPYEVWSDIVCRILQHGLALSPELRARVQVRVASLTCYSIRAQFKKSLPVIMATKLSALGLADVMVSARPDLVVVSPVGRRVRLTHNATPGARDVASAIERRHFSGKFYAVAGERGRVVVYGRFGGQIVTGEVLRSCWGLYRKALLGTLPSELLGVDTMAGLMPRMASRHFREYALALCDVVSREQPERRKRHLQKWLKCTDNLGFLSMLSYGVCHDSTCRALWGDVVAAVGRTLELVGPTVTFCLGEAVPGDLLEAFRSNAGNTLILIEALIDSDVLGCGGLASIVSRLMTNKMGVVAPVVRALPRSRGYDELVAGFVTVGRRLGRGDIARDLLWSVSSKQQAELLLALTAVNPSLAPNIIRGSWSFKHGERMVAAHHGLLRYWVDVTAPERLMAHMLMHRNFSAVRDVALLNPYLAARSAVHCCAGGDGKKSRAIVAAVGYVVEHAGRPACQGRSDALLRLLGCLCRRELPKPEDLVGLHRTGIAGVWQPPIVKLVSPLLAPDA